MLFGIKTLTISLRSAVKCNICKRPWNQQVFSVVFKNTSLQHLAGAGRLSSPRQLPVMVISHSFSNTHTHAHLRPPPPHPLQLTHFLICTLAHIRTLEHSCSFFFFSRLSPFDNTTSSLTSSRSAPLSVLQRQSLL